MFIKVELIDIGTLLFEEDQILFCLLLSEFDSSFQTVSRENDIESFEIDGRYDSFFLNILVSEEKVSVVVITCSSCKPSHSIPLIHLITCFLEFLIIHENSS